MGHGQRSTGCRVESLLSGVGCHAWVLLLRLLLLVRLGLRFVPQLLTELSGVRLSLLPLLLLVGLLGVAVDARTDTASCLPALGPLAVRCS